MIRKTRERWNVPGSWKWANLSELGEIVSGGTPSTKEPSYWGNEINWISPADLTGFTAKTIRQGGKSLSKIGLANSSAKVMPAGSVHFSSRAPIGYVVIGSQPLATNQGFKSLVPAAGIFNEYVYYYLMASRDYARRRASGTTFLELSGRAFGDLRIPVAPKATQYRIVAKIEELFSELDEGVESLKTARAQLKVYRQAVLKHAFEGKLTAQWREENKDNLKTAEQLLIRIKRERTAYYETALEEWKRALTEWHANDEKGRRPAKPKRPIWTVEINRSGLREIPVGWRYFPFGILAVKIRNGISVRPDEKGPLKIFRISAVRPMSFDLQDCRKITDIDGRYQDYRLSYGDLVFTRYSGSRDYVGVSAMYRGDGSHVYPDKLIRCEIKSEVLEPAYLEAATNSGESRTFIEKRIRTTAGQSGISGGDIKAMPVPICSDLEQAEIVRILEAKFKVTEVIESQLEAALVDAETFRRAILKKAFSGELVEQDPNDEPAAVLLERIKAEKASQKRGAKTRQRKVVNA